MNIINNMRFSRPMQVVTAERKTPMAREVSRVSGQIEKKEKFDAKNTFSR